MIAIRAHFDGEKIILPAEVQGAPPGDVILVFEGDPESAKERRAWTKAQETALARVWNNDDDDVYDTL